MDDHEARADGTGAGDTPATLQYYARLVLRRWWLPLSFLVLGVSLALVYTGLQSTAYAARSTILLSPLDPGTADELPRLAPTVARVVRSDAVLLQARRSYTAGRSGARGAAVTLDDLRSRTTVRVPRDTSLFEVTAHGRTQEDANLLVRAVVGAATRQLAQLGGAQGRGRGQAQLRVAVLGPPIPEGKVSPTPARNLLLGANLGILLGIAAALLVRDPQRARVRADVLTRYLETPNLVYAPLPRARAVEQLSRIAWPPPGRTLEFGSNGRQAEGIRLLGGRLSQWFEQDRRTVLLVGDLSPQTLRSVALRLAAHLSRAGFDPVVLEADFHGSGWRPRAGEQPRGLGEVLEDGDSEPEAVLVETSTNGTGPSAVTIVPRGTAHAEPALLFASDAFRSLLERFASRSQVVLVVGPPTEFQAEVLALADAAGGVVLLVPPWIARSRVASLLTLRNVADETSVLVSVFGEPDAIPLAPPIERAPRV
jgi:hypothetical protein